MNYLLDCNLPSAPNIAPKTASIPPVAIPKWADELGDDELLDSIQQQTIRYFWDGAHPVSGLACDRQITRCGPVNDLVAIGGSGFGFMAIIVAIDRRWIDPAVGLTRVLGMLDFLVKVPRYRGMFPHFIHGKTGKTIPFTRKDDGADLVETTLLFQGLICVREYFNGATPGEQRLRNQVNQLLCQAQWNWFTRGGQELYWHWSPTYGWAKNNPMTGWNECLLPFILAAGSTTYGIDPQVYHGGFARGPCFRNDRHYHGLALPLGPAFGGPLFFAHYSFCGLDPRGLADRYADYWHQNVQHVRINHQHCVINPHGHKGYGPDCWGLTASHGPYGYVAHSPDRDLGVITPSAALASLPYLPEKALCALRGFLTRPRNRIWGRFGFIDAFCDNRNWYSKTYLAVDQGPIIAMIENHRTGLFWKLFMKAPEVRSGLAALGFSSPHLSVGSRYLP